MVEHEGRSRAALRPLTEELLLTRVWASPAFLSPFRTAAGIVAACAGDWAASRGTSSDGRPPY